MISQRAVFLKHLGQTTPFPLLVEVTHAEGVWMYGPHGQKYLDLISGIGVSCLGHRHPAVVKAITDQANKYLHLMCYGEYVQTPQVQLAQMLTDSLPHPLNMVYLVNSGSEATEGAMKMAKHYTGRQQILACHLAYHGSTQGALSISGSHKLKQGYHPLLPGCGFIGFNSFADLAKITPEVAAVFVETVQGEAGVVPPQTQWLQALRHRCTEVGALLVLDEIQAGVGRTGTLWAFEQHNIVPDVLLMGKGLGGGMPIGAFVAPDYIMRTLSNKPLLGHITTFGGHPVNAAAAVATLTELKKINLAKTVNHVAQRFKNNLTAKPIIEVRNAGLMMAVELGNFNFLQRVISRCINNGVITDWFVFCDTALRIAPPLIIADSEIDFACQVINQAIEAEC